jgi:predicted PurR-regulated permease PerM
MALPVGQQAKYWGIATATFLVTLWFLGDVILPFVLGGAIALTHWPTGWNGPDAAAHWPWPSSP